MRYLTPTFAVLWLLTAAVAHAQEKKVEAFTAAPPADVLSPEVAEVLSHDGVKVSQGEKLLAEFWFRKDIPAKAGFTPTANVLYPFESGELIGVVRFSSTREDFRNQQFRRGVYTLRYGQQPVDGNHVGTSDTLDFLLLLPAKKDKTVEKLAPNKMFNLSAEVSGSTHPAILSMLAATGDSKPPAVAHDAARELWSLKVALPIKAGDDAKTLPVEFVIEGHSPE
jgi:hypothetical protein